MNSVPLFNRKVLTELSAELGEDGTIEVMKVFLADTARKMRVIGTDGLSRSLVKREAHSIKSSAATFGFERLSKLARELEAAVEDMDATPLAASIRTLRQTFSETAGFAETELLATAGVSR